MFNTSRALIRSGAPWRMLPNDLSPWAIVCQQTDRWLKASAFESMGHDLHVLLREVAGRIGQPSAVILDSRKPHRSEVERSFAWATRFRRLLVLQQVLQRVGH